MKNFNYLTLEVLSIEELASVKGGEGGYGTPTPIIIVEDLAGSEGGYGTPTPIIIVED